jgi:hypothetical protein
MVNGPAPRRQSNEENAIRVGVRLAQIEIDPRREQSTEDGVHHHDREILGVPARHAHVADPKLRLRRVGLADDVNGARQPGRLIGRRQMRRRTSFPCSERIARHGVGRRVVDVPHDDQRRRRWRITRLIERRHNVASQAADGCFDAAVG